MGPVGPLDKAFHYFSPPSIRVTLFYKKFEIRTDIGPIFLQAILIPVQAQKIWA